jgi:hypothetical protein
MSQGQPELYSKTLSQKQNKMKKCFKRLKKMRTEGMDQAEECLPSNH